MKKKIIMALSLVSVALLSIGGTLAWLTDGDTGRNAFTIGNVEIDLVSAEGAQVQTKLVPNNDLKQTPKYAIKSAEGSEPAYVWLEVAVPAALDNLTSASENLLHWNTAGAYDDKWYENSSYWATVGIDKQAAFEETWHVVADKSGNQISELVKIDGVDYNVYTLYYNGVLNGGETTTPGLWSFYLDQRIDCELVGTTQSCFKVENGVRGDNIDFDFSKDAIKVNAYAMQKAGFANQEEAIAAFYEQWDNGYAEVK